VDLWFRTKFVQSGTQTNHPVVTKVATHGFRLSLTSLLERLFFSPVHLFIYSYLIAKSSIQDVMGPPHLFTNWNGKKTVH